MEKNMIIKGMTCPHCNVRVENALNSVDGVKARVRRQVMASKPQGLRADV